MPTYEYQCDACEHTFEEFQSMKDAPLKKCPACGKNKLRRLIGAGAALLFKGSGFYITDYRSESYKAAAKKEQEGTSKSEKPDAGKGEGAKTESGKSEAGGSKPAKGTGKASKPGD